MSTYMRSRSRFMQGLIIALPRLSHTFLSMNSTTSIVGWTSEPQGRGTLGLLWSCFATIFLCTWSAIHPNLPDLSHRQSRVFLQRMQHVVLCLLAPEFFGLLALINLAEAREVRARSPGWPLKRCFFFLMGGLQVEYEFNDQRYRKRLRPGTLLNLLEKQSLPWPEIDDAEIDDRSKADGLVKLFALIQITWFIAQAIGRPTQKLAVTTIELFTLGIVIWAMVIYGVSWEKPFDVRRPIVVQVQNDENILHNEAESERVGMLAGYGLSYKNENWYILFCLVITLGFSALHVAAWSFHFSTTTELWLWRISSILCTVVPVLSIVAILLDIDTDKQPAHFLVIAAIVLYCIGRVYMFVEMFVGLRAVPASVYMTPQWSQYFPSLG